MANVRQDLEAWDAVAAFWHERMGEGNDFVEVLIWPAVRRLLPDLPGSRVLDVGCGNGLYARKLAAQGARVMAVDHSPEMILHARAATRDRDIEYRVVDATDPRELGSLTDRGFDAVVSTMALMDMAEIGPLFRSLPSMLRPDGVFVFATPHPCFNSPYAVLQPGDGTGGGASARARVGVAAYRTPSRTLEVAIRGQPAKTPCYHRPLSELLRPAFEAGLVLDALEETAFPPDHPDGSTPGSWGGRYHEFPAVLVGRLRPSARRAGAVGGTPTRDDG